MPGGAKSNAEAIARKLEALADSIRFDSEIGNKNLGRDMAAAVSDGVLQRSAGDQTDPAGNKWPENQGVYGEKKRAAALIIGSGPKRKKPVGSKMLSLQELKGKVQITEEGQKLTVVYGTNSANRRKASWFTNGTTGDDGERSGAKNQPPRPFFGMDETIRSALRKLAKDHIMSIIKGIMGKSANVR